MRAHIFELAAMMACFAALASSAVAFEGRINAVMTRGNETNALLYTVGTNFVRVEMTATNWPNPVDILDRNSGTMTLMFPHNRSFVRLKPTVENSSALPPGFPQMPAGLPPGVGPQAQSANSPGVPTLTGVAQLPTPPSGLPPGIGAQGPGARGVPVIPGIRNVPAPGGTLQLAAMPVIPMPMGKMELEATGKKTNLLGFACEKFELKQRGEIVEIWATDQLLPFQNYVRNQSPRFGPRMTEEQWAGLLTAKKLFPLRASLRFENGAERYRFEVQSVTSQRLRNQDLKLFQPPDRYFEIEPLPF